MKEITLYANVGQLVTTIFSVDADLDLGQYKWPGVFRALDYSGNLEMIGSKWIPTKMAEGRTYPPELVITFIARQLGIGEVFGCVQLNAREQIFYEIHYTIHVVDNDLILRDFEES